MKEKIVYDQNGNNLSLQITSKIKHDPAGGQFLYIIVLCLTTKIHYGSRLGFIRQIPDKLDKFFIKVKSRYRS